MKKVLFILIGIGITTPALASEEIFYQSFWGTAHRLNKAIIEPWCKGMETATAGKMVMHFNALNTLVKPNAMPRAIKNGSLEAGGILLQTASSMMPLSQLLSLPFLVQNAEEAAVMAWKMLETFPEIRAEAHAHFHILSVLGSDRYAFGSVKNPIRTPADLAGKRVLVWTPHQIEEIKAWGGIPVQISSSETYMGLQRGLGEVAYVPFPAMQSDKLAEVVKFITPIPSRVLPLAIVINKEIWTNLPSEAKNYLNSTTGAHLGLRLGQALVNLSAEDVVRHTAIGCTFHELTHEEQAAFKQAAAAANQAYWGDMLRRNKVEDPEGWIAKVEKLAGETFGR